MCGIIGIVGTDASEPLLRRALASLQHRGPDGSGVYVDGEAGVALGHSRLAVIDIEGGAQPLFAADGDRVGVCNGEVYDFARLRGQLEQRGCTFTTRTDAELILGLYQLYGTDLFDHLRGEFAWLLYDRARHRLIAARDRFGAKPLYFAATRGGLVFASEVKGILATGLVEAKLDPVALRDSLNGVTADPVFVGVSALPPGSFLDVDVRTGEFRVRRYFSLALADPPLSGRSRADWRDAVAEELTDAVHLRLRADVPVGCYLSGGIDSTLVASLAAAHTSGSLHTFTLAFPQTPLDETEPAAATAARLGAQHLIVPATPPALIGALAAATWHVEQPALEARGVARYLLSAAAREQVKVILSGEGADEVFLGYDALRPPYRRPTNRRGWLHWLFPEEARAELDATRLEQRMRDDPEYRPLGRVDLLTWTRHLRLRTVLARHILVALGDRVELANGIEGRLPFLDHRLWQLCRSIPINILLDGTLDKQLLREIAAPHVTPNDAARAKRPFAAPALPFARRRSNGLEPWVAEHLAPRVIRDSGLFAVSAVERLLAAADAGHAVDASSGAPQTTAASPPPAGEAARAVDPDRLLLFVLTSQMLHAAFTSGPAGLLAPPPLRKLSESEARHAS